jgi:GNAT superfamily N-acetyltransferase
MANRIRRATEADAEDAIVTLRRSITELCIADHRGNPEILTAWLENKTVETWANWIADNTLIVRVAAGRERVVGVGMANLQGEILLNYVHPDARFTGVSKAMLAALEAELKAIRINQCRLKSTITARSFHMGRGFRPSTEDTSALTKLL